MHKITLQTQCLEFFGGNMNKMQRIASKTRVESKKRKPTQKEKKKQGKQLTILYEKKYTQFFKIR
jgi:hypothetical protein